jgi:hypothetical protein
MREGGVVVVVVVVAVVAVSAASTTDSLIIFLIELHSELTEEYVMSYHIISNTIQYN